MKTTDQFICGKIVQQMLNNGGLDSSVAPQKLMKGKSAPLEKRETALEVSCHV